VPLEAAASLLQEKRMRRPFTRHFSHIDQITCAAV
jgi:hypothetical protein